MTQPDTDHQQSATETPVASKRSRALKVAAIAVAAVAFVAGIIWLVNVTGSAAPVDYRVTASGNISATWSSEDATGKLDLYNGSDTQTLRAGTLTITVQSTMPGGASCQIDDAQGTVVDSQTARPTNGGSGLGAWTTVTCTTAKH